MKMSNWVLLMVSVSLAGFWMQLPTPYASVTQQGSGYVKVLCDDPSSITCNDSVIGKIGWAGLIGLGAVGVVAYVSGFSAIYILAILCLVSMFNFFLMPDFLAPGLLASQSIPGAIAFPLTVFINIITVVGILSFVRGFE